MPEQDHHHNYRVFASLVALIKLITDSFGVFMSFVPPLNAAFTGILSLLEMGEALFLKEETLKHRAVKVATAAMAVSLSVAAAVLIFNPATAPIAASLIVASIATSTIKEGYLWYKRHKDYQTCHKILDHLQEKRQTLKDPHELQAIDAQISKVSHYADHCQIRIREHRTSFIYNALSLAGAVLLTVAAFALVGAIISNPIGLGIAGVALIGVATGFAIAERIRARQKIKNAPVKASPEHSPMEDTAQIVHQLGSQLDLRVAIKADPILSSETEELVSQYSPPNSPKLEKNPSTEESEEQKEGQESPGPTQH